MSIIDRKIRQKEEVRANILDTAWGLVVAEGWHSFSIRKIADAIEYSVPVIYSHFENKDAILLEFNRKGFALLTEALAEARAELPNPADQIRTMGRAYWKWAFANKEYYQLMFGLGIPTCEAVRKIPAMADFSSVITGSILAMAPAGQQPPFEPFLKYQSFWSMLHGLVSINMVAVTGKAGGHDGLPEAVLEDVMCSFIRGIEAAVSSVAEGGQEASAVDAGGLVKSGGQPLDEGSRSINEDDPTGKGIDRRPENKPTGKAGCNDEEA